MLEFLAEYKEEMALVVLALTLFWKFADLRKFVMEFLSARNAKAEAEARKAEAERQRKLEEERRQREREEEIRQRKREEVKTEMAIKSDSAELMARLDGTPGLWEVVEGSRPPEDVPTMKGLTKEWFSLYHTIYMHREAGSLSDERWAEYAGEMQKFVHFPYIRQNLDFADAFSPAFGEYLRTLIRNKT